MQKFCPLSMRWDAPARTKQACPSSPCGTIVAPDLPRLAMIFFVSLFMIVALVAATAAVYAVVSRKVYNPKLRIAYYAWIVVSAIATYLTTFHVSYPYDANTVIFGWPIPLGVFQRQSAASPWVDFVGPGLLLAYPLNLLLFLFIPSVLVVIHWLRHKPPTSL